MATATAVLATLTAIAGCTWMSNNSESNPSSSAQGSNRGGQGGESRELVPRDGFLNVKCVADPPNRWTSVPHQTDFELTAERLGGASIDAVKKGAYVPTTCDSPVPWGQVMTNRAVQIEGMGEQGFSETCLILDSVYPFQPGSDGAKHPIVACPQLTDFIR